MELIFSALFWALWASGLSAVVFTVLYAIEDAAEHWSFTWAVRAYLVALSTGYAIAMLHVWTGK